MLQRIPVGQNYTVIQGLSKIFRAIHAALEIPGLSTVDTRVNLYKVVAVLPRFLFIGPCRDEGGREVAVFKVVAVRLTRLFLPGGAGVLWRDYLSVCKVVGANRNPKRIVSVPGSDGVETALFEDEVVQDRHA